MAANGATKLSTTRFVPITYAVTNDQPVTTLDARTAFEKLTEREQLYAHYLARASFWGGLIVLVQTSPESPSIYRLIQRINHGQTTEELKASVVNDNNGITDEDFVAFLVYCSGVLNNMGNYKGFGDSKIVPDMQQVILEAIVKGSKAWTDDPKVMEELWDLVKGPMFSLSDREKQLGLGDKGITTYFTPNCNDKDAVMINRFFKKMNMEGYINRVIKISKGGQDGRDLYEIRNAASEKSLFGDRQVFEGADFIVTCGDYSPLLHKVNENLSKAVQFAANDDERKMLTNYIESFTKGSLDAHKNGSRHWIKNKGPTVETYIGFIETYRDPVGMRGEFEGFVAMVNKEQSAKFQELVNQAENFLTLLPWPKEYEKDIFIRPDFTSLDVLAFAGSGVPAGINIPNCKYYEGKKYLF
jgi:dipeptidyl-peptidase-3